MTRPAFVFDPDRCTACEACRIACGIENNEGRDTGWRTVMTFNPSRHPALPVLNLTLACNHCDTPACAIGCPANAYDRDESTGAVLLHPEKCIGCRYCSWLCPYDAPCFDDEAGVMTKCTFCSPRVAAGGQPACTQACPTGALAFGVRLDDAPEPVFAGLGTTGLGPALKVLTPRRSTPPPALAIDAILGEAPDREPLQPVPPRKITLRSEWALLWFTVVMPALVGWLGGGLVRPSRFPSPLVFGLLGVASLILSTIHLGRPLRAWRAVLNLRSSWLSREIVFANLFLVTGLVRLAFPGLPIGVGWAALAAGIGLAISIDAVYRAVPRAERGRMHSAETLPTVALLVGIVGSVTPLTWIAGGLKAMLFLKRSIRLEGPIVPVLGPGMAMLRLAGALRLTVLALACVPAVPWWPSFGLAIIGEILDRSAFYLRLEPTSPSRRMAEEMAHAAP